MLTAELCAQDLGLKLGAYRVQYKSVLLKLAECFGAFVTFNTKEQNVKEQEFIDRYITNNDCSQFNGKIVYCIDGSGTEIFQPGSHKKAQPNYCFWKHQYRLGFWAICSLSGRIQYITDVYCGKTTDESALADDKTFQRSFLQHSEHGKDGEKVFILGDRGYRRQAQIGKSLFGVTATGLKDQSQEPTRSKKHLTPTAAEASAGVSATDAQQQQRTTGKRKRFVVPIVVAPTVEEPEQEEEIDINDGQIDDDEDYDGGNFKHITFSPNFCPPRSVIERVFGKIKRLCRYIHGPVRLSAQNQMNSMLRIYAGILNVLWEKNNEYLTKKNVEDDEEDEEENNDNNDDE